MDSQTSDSMQSILSRNGTANSSSKNSYFGEDNDENEHEEEEEEEEITPAELIIKLQQVKIILILNL
jgi:hypothetical protein